MSKNLYNIPVQILKYIDMNLLSLDLQSEIYCEFPAVRGTLVSSYLKHHKIFESLFAQNNNVQQMCKDYNFTINDLYEIPKHIYQRESELYQESFPLFKMPLIIASIIKFKHFQKLLYYLNEKKEKPTTSRDPFQLKRSCIIVIECLLTEEFNRIIKEIAIPLNKQTNHINSTRKEWNILKILHPIMQSTSDNFLQKHNQLTEKEEEIYESQQLNHQRFIYHDCIEPFLDKEEKLMIRKMLCNFFTQTANKI